MQVSSTPAKSTTCSPRTEHSFTSVQRRVMYRTSSAKPGPGRTLPRTVTWKESWRTSCKPCDAEQLDRKSTRLNSSHLGISYAVFCLKKKKKTTHITLLLSLLLLYTSPVRLTST